MRNYIQPGHTLSIPAPAAVASGEPVIVGEIIGIAAGDAASGETVDISVAGVFELPKVAADDVSLGDAIFWDETAKLATVTESDNAPLGVAVADAGESSATVKLRLHG